MQTVQDIHIGFLSPASANQPHLQNLQKILPQRVILTHEGLDILGDSYRGLTGKSDEIAARAVDFVRRHQVQGLIVAGGFVTLFNPGLEAKVCAVTGLPVASAVASVAMALKAIAVESLLLMTPFDAASDAVIKDHFTKLGFQVFLGPAFENRRPGAGTGLTPNELFDLVERSLAANPTAQSIYFQGGSMDPLPILQKIEDSLKTTVLASNAAMLWHLLSLLGHKFSVTGYGKLLSLWPSMK